MEAVAGGRLGGGWVEAVAGWRLVEDVGRSPSCSPLAWIRDAVCIYRVTTHICTIEGTPLLCSIAVVCIISYSHIVLVLFWHYSFIVSFIIINFSGNKDKSEEYIHTYIYI